MGIVDDVCKTSLVVDEMFDVPTKSYTAMFYGLGSDGTVGANKNSIKIIGEETDNYAQGYFVYDSKKAGAMTVSHLRFGPEAIRSPYLVKKADFLACHNPSFLEKYDMLSHVKPGGTFLLTSLHTADEVWNTLPVEVQQQIIKKKLKFYVIDAINIAEELGWLAINVIMQTAFFKISGVVTPRPPSRRSGFNQEKLRSKGDKVVNMNNAAGRGHEQDLRVNVPSGDQCDAWRMVPTRPSLSRTSRRKAGRGDLLPVSKMPCGGKFRQPTNTKSATLRAYSRLGAGYLHQVRSVSLVCPTRPSASRRIGRSLRMPPRRSRASRPRARTLPE